MGVLRKRMPLLNRWLQIVTRESLGRLVGVHSTWLDSLRGSVQGSGGR